MVGKRLRSLLSERSRENDSRLILALDVASEDIRKKDIEGKYLRILKSVSDHIVAVKVGYPLVLKTGLSIFSKINEQTGVPLIADFKIADVPHVCGQIAAYAYDSGADGVIAHGFVGKDSLEAVIEAAIERGDRGVIVVPSMSHEGGKMFISSFTDEMLQMASDLDVTGIIGPATRPEDVRRLRDNVDKEMLILTPGIGAQGAKPGDAIRNGANYEIVGRAIYTSNEPDRKADEIRKAMNR